MPRPDISDRHSICGLQPQRAGRLLMSLCRRQIIRLRKKYTTQGEMGLIHDNRDRRPQHRIGEEIRLNVLRLYREKYHDFNFSHFTDCLVERLWNTMQDRLPGELRLLGMTDVDGANDVLPKLIAKHNEKFAVLPAYPESAYVEPAERVDVDFLFAHREMRKTDGGGSISYKGRTYAPCHPEKASMARSDVEVRETLSGKV